MAQPRVGTEKAKPRTRARTSRGRGRPTKRAAGDIADTIVDTALACFRQRGFEAASIDAIAAACRISKHTLYRRFPSKDALFIAAGDRERQAVLQRLAGIDVSGRDTMSALKETCAALFEIAVSPGSADLYRMCIGAVPKFPMIGLEFAVSEQRIQEMLMPLVVRAQAEGLLITCDARQLSVHLYYSIIGEIWNHALLGLPYVQDLASRTAVFEANWAIFLEGTRPH